MPSKPTMKPFDPVMFRQLPVIRKIVADETWLEGERRGCAVLPTDPMVRENVCRVILRIGAQLREALTRAATADVAAGAGTVEGGAMESMTRLAEQHDHAA